MRKWIVDRDFQHIAPVDQSWLDLQRLAQVEVTSEDPAYPIEAALLPGATSGWRAAQAGPQTIRLLFDKTQKVKRIRLLFHESQQARTQEFVLRYSPERDESYREIVRQQYHFSPPSTTSELEDYLVDLTKVMVLELKIVPDITGGDARASVAQFGLA